MPYAKLRTELLVAREQRELHRAQASQFVGQTLVQLSLNLPGSDKDPPGAQTLFNWGLRKVLELLPLVENYFCRNDMLGPWALIGTCLEPQRMKIQAIDVENSTPASRLLDIDVYDWTGQQVGRKELGFPARSCLICEQPAVVCIRQQAHSQQELRVRIYELLVPFRA